MRALLCSLLSLVACAGRDSDTGGDADTDSDADTDTDEVADVCDDGVAPFDNLQDAVDAASSGDEVTLCAGHWGRVEWAGKGVSLRGLDGAAETWIEGDADHPGLTVVAAPSGTLTGLTLTGDGAALTIVASIQDSTLTLEDVHVTGVISDNSVNRYGVFVEGGAVDFVGTEWFDNYEVGYLLHLDQGDYSLAHSSFHDNIGSAFLVEVTDSSVADCTNNLFYRNDANGAGFALSYDPSSTGRAAHNTFVSNVNQADANVVAGIDFDDNLSYDAGGTYGFILASADAEYNLAYSTQASFPLQQNSTGDGNVEADPLLVDPDNGDFHLDSGSPAIDAGDPLGPEDVDGSRSDIGAYGGPDPYPD